jgi:hypothetical protein
MKQILMVAISLIASVSSFSQVKKTTPISKVAVKTPPTELQVNSVASTWFKKNYVESNFKDPYSFKLLKVKSFPVTEYQHAEDDYKSANEKVSKRDSFMYKYASENLAKALKDSAERFEKRETTYKSLYKWSLNDIQRNKQTISEINERWRKEENESDSLKKVFESLPIVSKKNIVYYLVSIDCYANNSYGNPILGVYVFKFFYETKNGYSVVRMND